MTKTSPVIAVSGSAGLLGGRVARILSEKGASTVLFGRELSRLPELPGAEKRGPAEYGDLEAMTAVLSGVDTFLLISGRLSSLRVQEHTTAVDAAVAAGVKRIVYVSLMGAAENATYIFAREHWLTEQHIERSGLRYTILRPSYYSSMLPRLVKEDGLITGPAGDGRVSAVSHDDIAAVAAAVLLDDSAELDGQYLDISGPEAVTLTEAAAILTEALGTPFRYENESVESAKAWREKLPDVPPKPGWVSWYEAIAAGDMANVTDVVERFTGRPPLTIAETVTAP